LYTVIKKQRPD